MTKYGIKYYYYTGDSFGSTDEEAILEIDWESLQSAKEALQKIKEHYKWYKYKSSSRFSGLEKVKKPKWWNCKTKYKDMEHYLINFPTDLGKDFQMWCPWCGYFEGLYSAEIIPIDKDLSFEIDYP